MTLAERRKRIREIRSTLGLALLYTGLPSKDFKNMSRSDQMLVYASNMLWSLNHDLGKDGS